MASCREGGRGWWEGGGEGQWGRGLSRCWQRRAESTSACSWGSAAAAAPTAAPATSTAAGSSSSSGGSSGSCSSKTSSSHGCPSPAPPIAHLAHSLHHCPAAAQYNCSPAAVGHLRRWHSRAHLHCLRCSTGAWCKEVCVFVLCENMLEARVGAAQVVPASSVETARFDEMGGYHPPAPYTQVKLGPGHPPPACYLHAYGAYGKQDDVSFAPYRWGPCALQHLTAFSLASSLRVWLGILNVECCTQTHTHPHTPTHTLHTHT